jgi:putative nucleotidyltransferase with HDIG domain
LLAAAIAFVPINPAIGGLVGLAFWVCLTLVASALPVRLPAGTTISVGFAPLLTAMVLGGPTAAAVVALVGTFDAREVKREIPWYGTATNHALIAIPAILAAALYYLIVYGSLVPETFSPIVPAWVQFVAVVLVGISQYLLNTALAVLVASLRSGQSVRSILANDVRGTAANLIALVPLAWLMAEIFQLPNGVGWWATPLFVVPLFTTRLAYHRYVETRSLFEQTIGALAKAVDARDRYTRGHSGRVSHIAEAMCRVLRIPENEIEVIKWAGLLHDVGKIGVRDNVLLKEGPLDKHERVLMNQHPIIGAEIVAPASQLTQEAPLIRWHHEWFNGSGYPDGIEALDIPLGARILGVADSYEAMTSARPYRKTPLTHEQAIGELRKFSGIQFDPELVPVLIGLPREILDRHPDSDDELPTMLHQEDPRDRPVEEEEETTETPRRALPPAAAAATAAPPTAAAAEQQRNQHKRRMLADDVS